MTTNPTTLYLIRHGETDWNMNGRWQGHADIPLNSRGLEQARLLAQRLLDEQVHFDAIYSSDLSRAYQTAWEIGAALRIAVQLLPPLREIDLGEWSGLTRDEICRRFPIEYRLLEQGQDIPRGNAETRAAMAHRVIESVSAMVWQHPGERLALVTHGGPVRALLGHAGSAAPGVVVPRTRSIGNTSVSVVSCRPVGGWTIISANDVAHLRSQADRTDLVTEPPDDGQLLANVDDASEPGGDLA